MQFSDPNNAQLAQNIFRIFALLEELYRFDGTTFMVERYRISKEPIGGFPKLAASIEFGGVIVWLAAGGTASWCFEGPWQEDATREIAEAYQHLAAVKDAKLKAIAVKDAEIAEQKQERKRATERMLTTLFHQHN